MASPVRKLNGSMHIPRALATPLTGSNCDITILLVDDQPAVRYGLQLIFELEMEPLRIWEAGSSAEAIALVERVQPDVVIMDVDLPDDNGIITTQQLTQLLPHCLIIILTIHSRPDVRSHALAAGAWAFVEKGKPDEMRLTLHQAIQYLRGRMPPAPPATLGGRFL